MNASRKRRVHHETLTCLNRIADEESQAREWLLDSLRAGVHELAEVAFDVAVESGQPIGTSLATVFTGPVSDGNLLEAFFRCHRIPYRDALALREVALVVTARVREAVLSMPEPASDDAQLAAASLHDLFSLRAFENGIHDAALDASRQAVALFEALLNERPDDPRRSGRLAGGLLNLGNYLAAIGHFREALEVIRRSERLIRAHGAEDSAEPSRLATSLEALSYVLARHRQLDEAVTAASEAAQLQVDSGGRGQQRIDLANSLNTLALRLRDSGRHSEARETLDRSLALFRELFHDRAEEFRADLAMCQLNRGLMLRSAGDMELAEKAHREAVVLYRKLARHQPEIFESDLALALQNHGDVLAESGRNEEAMAAMREAIGIHRHRANAASTEQLASALNNLGSWLAEMERFEESETWFAEALEIRETLFSEEPDAHREDLGVNLSNHAAALFQIGRSSEALAEARRAVRLLEPAGRRYAERYGHDLAIALHTLGNAHTALGAHRLALGAIDQSIELRRRLVRDGHATEVPGLARALYARALIANDLNLSRDSRESCREAWAMLQRSDGQLSDGQRLLEVDCGLTLAGLDLDDGHGDEAARWLLRLRRPLDHLLAEDGPFLLPALERLSDLAELWERAENDGEALQASQDAVSRCAGAVQDMAEARLVPPYLLYELGVRLANAGRPAEGVARLAEALGGLIAHRSESLAPSALASWHDLTEEIAGMYRRIADDAEVPRDDGLEERLAAVLAAADCPPPDAL